MDTPASSSYFRKLLCNMNKYLSLGFLLFFPWLVFAQSFESQEFERLINAPDDTTKVNQLLALVRKYVGDSLELSEQLAGEALRAAEKAGDEMSLVKAYKAKGTIINYRGGVEEAIECYDQALAICADRPEFKWEKISILLNIGVVYFYAGDDGKSLEYYIEAESLCNEPSTEDLRAKIFNNMAVIYRKLNRFEDAARIYQKSLKIKSNNKDSLGMATTLNNIGLCYGYMDDYDQSIDYLEQAKQLFVELGEEHEAKSVDLAIGMSLYETGKAQEAKLILESILLTGDLKIRMYELIQNELLLAKIYVEEEQYEKAEGMLNKVYPRLEGKQLNEALQSYYQLKASTLYHLNQVEGAYDYLLKHKYITDTILEAERVELEKEMETKYLTKEKETQIEIQQLELAKNKREKLLFILALIGLSIILVLGYFLYRQRQKANKLLNIKNAQIGKALHEKEILLKEIHHRVKNNLQIISSLLSLQSRQIDDPKALEAIKEGRNRVNSMALIHKNLYQEENLVGVDAAEYIDKLTASLMANYQIGEQEILVEKDIDQLQLDVDVVIPLGLILNELITNCLKYAFEEQDSCKIEMSLKKEQEGLRLKVTDNGKGLPSDFNLDQLSSMGFRLIKAFAQKLEAALNVTSAGGTQVELFIPSQ
jgi:two-component sensor histidine kinase/tetratricopeptide (TPR) repeat protein